MPLYEGASTVEGVSDVPDDLNPVYDFFGTDDLTNEIVLKLLRNAYLDASIEQDAVSVNERRSFWITPEPAGKRLWLQVIYNFKANVSEQDKLVYVNLINDQLPIVRACVSSKSGNLVLDWYLSVEGGITRRSIIYAIKHFLNFVDMAIDLDTNNIL